MKHFVSEKLYGVLYEDGDKEDMSPVEVVKAANLYRTEQQCASPASAPEAAQTDTPNIPAELVQEAIDHRVQEESNLPQMIDEFNNLCVEGEATDQSTRNTHDVHETERVFDGDDNSEDDGGDDDSQTLGANQCSWCGFSDHKRKTRAKCPQHPNGMVEIA